MLDAGGFESAAEHPFGILEQWGAIDGMGSPPPASPFVGAKLLHELLDRHADGGPVLLRLDDLQWADRESVEALTWMLQRASGDRLLVAIASRPLPSTIHPAWQRWSSGRGRVMPVAARRAHARGREPAACTTCRPRPERRHDPAALGAHGG